MKKSKKAFKSTGQSTLEAKKSQKHDANLQKNSTLYFQIGLILCLLGTYALFEMQFQDKMIIPVEDTVIDETFHLEQVKPFIVEVIKPKEPEPVRRKDIIDEVIPVKNDRDIIETIVKSAQEPKYVDAPISKPEDIIEHTIETPVDVPFYKVENAPIYPGCEKFDSNDERKQCMSNKLGKLILRKFNTDIATDNNIYGKQRIYTQFKIDKNGNITDIKIRTPHLVLEKEALRLIKKIPQMIPGYQRETAVGVIYKLPIVFQVRD
ncbi:energy transducer TonB [Winogradskyella sp. PE311]|uniref:energy transducer TonB n=1 Tax=Winogradskyella sp. PE311 TaxID=3366943 RepID=UPI003981059D